jgi:predicted nucleic acid-binding protein
MFPISPSDLDGVSPPCRDAKDNMLLALASVSQADVIVSSDNDLLVLHPWRGVSILTPSRFLTQFEV